MALSQLGNVGGRPYWSWYGFESRVDWCACFVSWCANECGYLDTGVIPRFASCSIGLQWFRERGLWRDHSYEPRPGDLIFFDWDDEDEGQDGAADHVGIVEKADGGIVYTVEGNSGDSNDAVLIIYLLLQTCYRPRISKETPGVYRSRRLFAYSMQRRFRVFRVFALTDTPRHSAKPLLFPIQATLLTFLPVFESAAELK